MKSEAVYQRELIKRIEKRIPGCTVEKSRPEDTQGIPDLTVYYGPRWGKLEVKAYKDAPVQPNQEYYVEHYNDMSFAAFIYPEIEDEVLDALQQSLGA